jgi:hypothetical protein
MKTKDLCKKSTGYAKLETFIIFHKKKISCRLQVLDKCSVLLTSALFCVQEMSRRASVFARQNPGRRRVRFPDEIVFEESIKGSVGGKAQIKKKPKYCLLRHTEFT